jgi:ubiquinone/menaquinone biosynthesis C-methylase UbiE
MTTEYFNNLATSWDARFTESNTAALEEMAARLDIKSGGNAIDIGCGTGIFTPFILKKLGNNGHLTCVDSACEMLKIAQKKGFEGNISYLCADIEVTGLESSQFDAAICYSSFPHFHDKLKSLCEINRLLKNDGKLFICHTSSRNHINSIHSRVPLLRNDIIPIEEKMRELLYGSGFTRISIMDVNDNYLVTAKVDRK